MPKTKMTVRDMGDGKCEVSVGAVWGLAVHDGDGWTLSPDLRRVVEEDTYAALLKRLDEFRPTALADQG